MPKSLSLFCRIALQSAGNVEFGWEDIGEAASMRKMVLGFLAVVALSLASMQVASTPAQAACAKNVVLYSAYWCPYCKQVRSLLGRYQIPYKLVEVTTSSGQSLMLRKFGDTGVPRTVIGGAVVVGNDPARIKQLLCLN
jgi:glutaredoxin